MDNDVTELGEIAHTLRMLELALLDKGAQLQHIKVNHALTDRGKQISTINGIAIKDVIYEDEAEYWRHTPALKAQPKGLAEVNEGIGFETESDVR